MRNIIFRAKNLDDWLEDKNSAKWFYGDLMHDGGESRCLFFQEDGSDMEVDPDTVGQFTGAYDCANKAIYEHDFVVFNSGSDTPKIILHSKNSAEFRLFSCTSIGFKMGYSYAVDYAESHEYYKVIGNLHDNPDLIPKPVYEKIIQFLREER